MEKEADARAYLELHSDDQCQHVLLNHDVERRCRFVGNDEFRPAHGGKRDSNTLAHAARKLMRESGKHRSRKVKAFEMPVHDVEELDLVELHMWKGEILERFADPADRVEHIH